MKKIVLIVLIAGLVIATLAMLYVFRPAKTTVSGKNPDYTISSTELFAAYSSDEAKSDSMYIDEVIQVSGVVTAFISDSANFSITLEGDDTGGIICSFNSKPENEKLPEVGSECTIKGKCTGFLMDVNLNLCSIVE